MRTCLRKNAVTLLTTIPLAGTLLCTSLHAQNQGQSQGGGGSQNAAPPNPYIQSAPNASGQIPQMPGSLIAPNQDAGNSMGAAVFYPDIKTYILAPGDLINVRLFSVPEYSTTLRLSKDGTGQLPLIGTLKFDGTTIEETQTKVEGMLKSAGMYRNPQITITLGEYDDTQSSVLFTGELHGRIPSRRAHTLAEALNVEGGLPTGASSIVSIIRPGVDEPIMVDLGTSAKDQAKANIPLLPRDTIFVQHSGAVYLVGAFKATGLYMMQPGRTTLMQVAALSGGPMFSAKYDDMRIIRTVGTERTEVKVDIEKVLYGKAPDPILQAGDIIFLPASQLKTALASGGIQTLIGLANLAVTVAVR